MEAGFREADAVVERTYTTPWIHQAYLEPQSSIAAPDGAGKMTIYTSTQGAYQTRSEVAAALGIPKHRVNVVTMEVGGGFGAKYALIDPLVAGAGLKAGRPVRLVYTRNDEFLAANPAPATIMKVKTGAKRDGTLTALQAKVVVDTGAYPGGTAGILCTLLGGTYRWPNLLIDGYDVLTHKPGCGAYRAPGAPQACFAIERQIDQLARQLDLDPLEFRLQERHRRGRPHARRFGLGAPRGARGAGGAAQPPRVAKPRAGRTGRGRRGRLRRLARRDRARQRRLPLERGWLAHRRGRVVGHQRDQDRVPVAGRRVVRDRPGEHQRYHGRYRHGPIRRRQRREQDHLYRRRGGRAGRG